MQRRNCMKIILTASLMLTIAVAATQPAQSEAPANKGMVERVKVHGKSLEGNLEGDSPDRDVSIYLPPGYKSDRHRRYPVVYMLHGFTGNDDRYFGRSKGIVNLPEVIDRALASGPSRPMIVVMPNAFTAFQGSFYSSSVTTGDWETFVAVDLVSYIDAHYRTIPDRMSRGLAGHSMGGYGTVRIGMKRPDVFSIIYALSPCCMKLDFNPQILAQAEKIQSMSEIAQADFPTKAALANGASWSPNPKKPPFFLDLPSENGQLQPAVMAKWDANAPLAMVDQYIPSLKKLHAIAFDAGDKDSNIANNIRTFDQILTSYAIAHIFEIYPGDHNSGIADRLEKKALPFFTNNLSFSAPRH
jgi:S-formylglutathione hydrolase